MSTSRASDKIAVHVGMSAPETPKYLLTNYFLLEYFEQTGKASDLYNYAWFEERGVLSTEDEDNKKQLEKAFNRFLERYLGDETIHNENKRVNEERHFYFPLIQDMLIEGNPTLRHILFCLQSLDGKFVFQEMQKKLEDFIFHNRSGAHSIWKVLFQDMQGIKLRERDTESEGEELLGVLGKHEQTRMRKLGKRLNRDLDTLLTHSNFTEQDFYRKYQYLSVLLTSYVIQYIMVRKGENAYLLCKGRPLDEQLNGEIHRACCHNYAQLRELFPTLLKNFYRKALEDFLGKEKMLQLVAKNGIILVQGVTFENVMKEISGGNRRSRSKITYDRLLQGLGLVDGQERSIEIDEFLLRFTSLIGSRQGSSLQKMTSILSTCGKQIDMVYPKSNVNSKYFAMSESLAEFYVRLHLAQEELQYDYFDNFMNKLVERYHIVIAKTAESEKYLKGTKPRLQAQEYRKNRQAFLDTLNAANCLIKLSDSGYIVTLPEAKGGFKLI